MTFDRRIPYAVSLAWQPHLRSMGGSVKRSGIEGITVRFKFARYAGHLVDKGYNGIALYNATSCWVRDVSAGAFAPAASKCARMSAPVDVPVKLHPPLLAGQGHQRRQWNLHGCRTHHGHRCAHCAAAAAAAAGAGGRQRSRLCTGSDPPRPPAPPAPAHNTQASSWDSPVPVTAKSPRGCRGTTAFRCLEGSRC